MKSLILGFFHLHAMVQSSQVQIDARERILASARVFNEEIETLSDLNHLSIDQLNYIANQHIAKHRLYSFAQGGMSGSGGLLLLGSDIPAMTVINVRIVQLIAMSYGVEVNTPFEMMLALKVFNAGAMPKRLQGIAWEELIREVQTAEDDYFYLGIEEIDKPYLDGTAAQAAVESIIHCRFPQKNWFGAYRSSAWPSGLDPIIK
ncbi:EcsC family protein [Peribacillus frigoritolerans]|nr:EcsC family protein [Peribacillus frigoritolerans]